MAKGKKPAKKTSGSMACPEVKKFRLSELNPSKYNPREIDPGALEGLANSLTRFGCVEPIVVNVKSGKNVIIGGHQRHKILSEQMEGSTKCLCITVDLSRNDEKLLNLALNNPHIQGQFSEDLNEHVSKLLECLKDEDLTVQLRIDDLLTEVQDDLPEQTRPDVEFTSELLEENNYIVFAFDNKLDWQVITDKFGIRTVKSLDSKKGYEKKGVGRVLNGNKLIRLIQGDQTDDFYSQL